MSIGQDREEEGCRAVVAFYYPREALEEHINGFIGGFPISCDFKSIFVVVDRFSKYSVFILAPDACPMEEATRLFFNHAVKYFGLPKDIVSDQDERFTKCFWTKLFKLLGLELKVFYNKPSPNRWTN